MKKKSTYLVRTLGCKSNFYDSQILEGQLLEAGLVPSSKEEAPDLCLVNSCAVTNSADVESRKMAERLAREFPASKVVLTGCGVEVDPEFYRKGKGVHALLSNREKPKFKNWVGDLLNEEKTNAPARDLGEAGGVLEFLSRHPMDQEWPMPEGLLEAPSQLDSHSGTKRERAFLKIQEGCNAFCTYCIIPYGRGPSRSLEVEKCITRIRDLVSNGVTEIVLTGTNLGDYEIPGFPRFESLPFLLEEILEKTFIERIRLGSLAPNEITPSLMKLMSLNSRLCPHWHVSLQSPLSKILKLMKRKYDGEEAREKLLELKEMNTPSGLRPFIGMDVITGFPGESKEDFEESLTVFESLPWDRIHVFPYSERKNTPATKLKNSVPVFDRKKRSEGLKRLSLERLRKNAALRLPLRLTGILLESAVRGPDGKRNWISGYTPDYWRVLFQIEEGNLEHLKGTIVSELPVASPSEILVDSRSQEVLFQADLKNFDTSLKSFFRTG